MTKLSEHKNSNRFINEYMRFLYKQRYFSTQPQCCLTFSWIGLQTLLRCFLMHISIIIQRHFLYLVYLCPCLDLGLIMSLCDLFFIFIFIFIMVNHIILWKQAHLFFRHFLEYFLLFLDDNMNNECEYFPNSKRFQPQGVA